MSEIIKPVETAEALQNQEQSSLFEDAFFKNLKGLQARVKQQHVRDMENKSGDMQYIGESTKKLVELKLMELDSIISARQKEEEWMRKREIRAAQSERLAQARSNLTTLLMLEEKGRVGLEDDIESNLSILREVDNIGGEDVVVVNKEPNAERILDSFHVNEKDLRKAFHSTNIFDVIREAKKNGWTLKVSEDEIALYNKQGKRVNDSNSQFLDFIDSETKKLKKLTPAQRSKNGKKINAAKKLGKSAKRK